MSDLVKEAGFGDDNVGNVRVDKFKATKDKVERIAFAWQGKNKDGEVKPKFLHTQTYFIPGHGYIIDKPGFSEIIGSRPKTRYGTIIVVYNTDKKGEFYKDENDKPVLSYEIKPWFFSVKKYQDLQSLDKKFPLVDHDLELVCNDEKYQNMTITPHHKSVLKSLLKNEKHKEKIMDEVARLKDTIANDIGRDINKEKLLEILGKGSSQSEPTENDEVYMTSEDDDDGDDEVLDTIDNLIDDSDI